VLKANSFFRFIFVIEQYIFIGLLVCFIVKVVSHIHNYLICYSMN